MLQHQSLMPQYEVIAHEMSVKRTEMYLNHLDEQIVAI